MLNSEDPEVRAEAFERAILAACGVPEDSDPDTWVEAYRALSTALTSERAASLAGQTSATLGGPAEAIVAGLIYAARTFQLARRILAAYPPVAGRFVELGAGWGPFALAAEGLGAPEIELVDVDRARMSLGAKLFARPPRLRVADLADPLERAAAGIAVPYALNEVLVRSGERAVAAGVDLVEGWLGGLAPGGRLYLLEPGTRQAARTLQAIRDRLTARARILAPCTHGSPCPLLAQATDWCHLTWSSELGPRARRLADLTRRRHQEVHFSWLVLEVGTTADSGRARVLEVRSRDRHKAGARLCAAEGILPLVALRRHAAAAALEALVPGAVVEVARAGLEARGDGLRLRGPEDLVVTSPL